MDRQEPQTRQIQEPVVATGDQGHATPAEPDLEEPVTPSPLQRFRALLDSARPNQNPVASRRELGRDKSKSLFVLVGASAALLLLFFGVFSSPKNRGPLPGDTARGGPSLGRKGISGSGAEWPCEDSNAAAQCRRESGGCRLRITSHSGGRGRNFAPL